MPNDASWEIASWVIDRFEQMGRYRPPIVLIIFGVGLVAFSLSQAVLYPAGLPILTWQIGVPLLLLLPLCYQIVEIRRSERAAGRQVWILVMSLLFAVIAAGTAILIIISETATGGGFQNWLFPLVISTAVGVGIGSIAGQNFEEVIVAREELDTEIQRTHRLNQRLTVINRILRHNVRNRITVALGLLDRMQSRSDDRSDIDDIRECRDSLRSLHQSAEKALELKSLWEEDTQTVITHLVPIVDEVVSRKQDEHTAATISLSTETTPTVQAHPLLWLAIEEAINNALEHNDPSSINIDISITTTDGRVVVTIVDDGTGVPVDELNAVDDGIEEPLHHTSGMGMWLIKWITENSRGTCSFSTNTAGGTTVQMTFSPA